MRAPYQVLIIPYKEENNVLLYGVLKRSDMDAYQGVAGGGEDGETVFESAVRECVEEIGIDKNSKFIRLDSLTKIPVEFITGKYTWGDDVYVVPEYAFGVDVAGQKITLSHEHTSIVFLPFEEAFKLFKYDSNKTALWELNERLIREKNNTSC